MRTAKPTAQADQVRHLSENLISQLTKGKEWATPEVEAALQKVVEGLDAGIESASPRIQAGLRRLADELAGGVETLVPRVHEGLKRVAPNVAPAPAKSRRTASGKAWLIAGAVAVAVTVGLAAWHFFRPAHEEPVPAVNAQRTSGANPEADTTPPPEDRT
ncbi:MULTISPECIES: hypothetical protein [unclassified Arthrobacter]|uniref:hypothetical protein n=1 Tax=unclassified Arthrobacter TaxID=235627 RepID=UPI001DBBDE8B|nr:hypothetical protein [Arthrobacter sp. Bi26]CAH0128314.1 hypothetical protein SRABI26_00157 [Arthrobacter sp. Bi26]